MSMGEQRTKKGSRGFTLLLAALVASIVLALGTAIFEIAQKEVTLSSIGRDSQFAFYAADTAAECALYWDFRFSYFATSTPSNPSAQNPTCDGQLLNAAVSSGDRASGNYAMTSQQMNFFQDTSTTGGYCAQVSVTKSIDPSTNAIKTLIHADGYNLNCASTLVSPRALQRSVELQY
jgi:Tfp pilus assembly protein PilX